MKKTAVAGVLLFLFICMGDTSKALSNNISIDLSNSDTGLVTIVYSKDFSSEVKAVFAKDDVEYIYHIKNARTDIPLQMGDGKYTISVYENIYDNKYSVAAQKSVTVTGLTDENVYTNSVQNVNYKDNAEVIADINSLLLIVDSDDEKVSILYEYIITSYSYSYSKAESVSSGYIPDLEQFITERSGICYDFASLFAAVLRSNGIPTKLLMGYRSAINNYHAWNEVLLSGEWVIIDTTVDAQRRSTGRTTVMEKDPAEFCVVREY